MHLRRKSKNNPAEQDIFVEVMEPRVLLSADALGVDSSVFDRGLHHQDDWELSVATNWWKGDANDISHSDSDSHTVESPDALEQSSSVDDGHVNYREIIFLDTGVTDGEQLLSDVLLNLDTDTAQVYLIDSNTDGIEQISTVLNDHQDLDSVHLISHGTVGKVQLGSGTLSSSNIESYSDQLNAWGRALSESGDILIYGCDLASDVEGQALVDSISTLTGADIAASIDSTGNADQSLDWDLEYQSGVVETAPLKWYQSQAWTGELALSAPTADAGGTYSINEGNDLNLDASGSSDSDGAIVEYTWDLNNDSIYSDFTSNSDSLLIDWATLVAWGMNDGDVGGTDYTIGLQVVDDDGETNETSTTVTIDNLAPILTTTGTGSVVIGNSYTLDLAAVDPGNDTISSWTINWGDGQIETFVGDPSSVNHTYTQVGFTHNILASAIDEDGTTLQNELLVASGGNDRVLQYDQVGSLLQSIGVGGGSDYPLDIIIGADGSHYVSGYNSDNVLRYDATGTLLNAFVPADTGGLDSAAGLAFGPDGNLYVASRQTSEVLRFDAASGAFIDAFVTAGSGGLDQAEGLIFGPDGNMYVSDFSNDAVYKYDGLTGTFDSIFVTSGDGGLNRAEDIAFGPDGNLYVASDGGHSVLRYDGSTGTYIDAFVPSGSNGLVNATGIAFGPDGNLYVGSWGSDSVLRFHGTSGAYIDEFVSSGEGGLDKTGYLNFIPDHQVTITPNNAPTASNLSSTSAYSEGDASVSITDIVLSDVDADEVITATLTLANTATGSLSANDGASYTAGTGVWTLSDSVANVNTALSNLVFNPASNNSLDTSIDIVIDDGDEDASGALTGTIVLDVSQGGPSTTVPADQNTDEDSTLVFSSGSGNAITVNDGAVGDSFLRTALSVTNGTLKLSTVAGLSFENGADETSAMTIIGLESAINTALEGLTFTPTADYEGLANLQLMSDSQKNLQGHYTFTQPGALGADTSPAGANAGTASGSGAEPDPSAVWDNSRGSDVLVLDGVDDNIQISGRFGMPTNLTLAAWVNVSATNNQEVISIGGSIALRLNESNFGLGVTGFFNDGMTWNHTNSNQTIGDDGWHHVAYTYDDTNDTQVIYIDGVALTTSYWTGSINWAHQSNSTIGSHADSVTNYWLSGMVDDVRVYDQALTAGQIESIASGAAEVSLTVDPINDAPQATNLTSTSAYIEGDASVAITDIVLSDVDVGDAISATLTLANTATGSLSANNGATYTAGTGIWSITDTVSNVNAALANVEFNPATDNDLDTTISIVIDDGDEDGSGALTGTISLDVTPQNDTPVLANNTGVTVDEGSAGTVVDNSQLRTTDVDNTAVQLVYRVTDPTDNGTLQLSGTVLNLSDTFTQDDIDNNRITYDHDGSETTADSFDFSVVDVVGAASTGTFSITVTPQNDEQTITNNAGATVNEGSTGVVISTSTLETSDVDNATTQLVYTLTSEPANGTLKLSGIELELNDTFTQNNIDNGELTYDHNGAEAPDDSFGFRVDDGAGSVSAGSYVFDVSPQNDEQIISVSSGATVNEGSVENAISSTLLRTTDTDHSATDLVYSVTAETSHGVLRLGETELTLGDTFTQDQINIGEISYDHDGSETSNDRFDFSVDDGVGSASLGTFSFAITAQNDEQQLITNTGTTVNSGSTGSTISGAMLATTDVDNTATQVLYKVVAIPSNGTLKLDGNALALNDTFTQDDIDNSRLTYDHNGSMTTSDSFVFTVDDGVGSSSTGTFNWTVSQESLVSLAISSAGNKVSIESMAPSVQLASSAETIQSAAVPAEEAESEPDSKSAAEISIDEEQADNIVTAADVQYQFAVDSSIASTNVASNSPQVTLISRLLQTPAIAGLLAAPFEFDALSLEINQILTSYEFNESMDSLRKDLDDSKFLRGAVVGSSVAVTTGLSVGYVAWMVRGGVLLSSVLSSLPAWQFIDPLPVLNFSEKEEEGGEQDDSLEDIIADHGKTTAVGPDSGSDEKPITPADTKEARQ